VNVLAAVKKSTQSVQLLDDIKTVAVPVLVQTLILSSRGSISPKILEDALLFHRRFVSQVLFCSNRSTSDITGIAESQAMNETCWELTELERSGNTFHTSFQPLTPRVPANFTSGSMQVTQPYIGSAAAKEMIVHNSQKIADNNAVLSVPVSKKKKSKMHECEKCGKTFPR
jgi:hypothetical protein